MTASRVVRHCFLDKTTADENLVTKRTLLVKLVYQGSRANYFALSRNGYSSLSYGTFNGQQIVDFIYFDAVLGKVMRLNPFTDTVAVDFNGVLLS